MSSVSGTNLGVLQMRGCVCVGVWRDVGCVCVGGVDDWRKRGDQYGGKKRWDLREGTLGIAIILPPLASNKSTLILAIDNQNQKTYLP